jgi:hypothetical protein
MYKCVYVQHASLFNYKEEWNYVFYRKMDGKGNHKVHWDKPNSEKQLSHIFAHMWM